MYSTIGMPVAPCGALWLHFRSAVLTSPRTGTTQLERPYSMCLLIPQSLKASQLARLQYTRRASTNPSSKACVAREQSGELHVQDQGDGGLPRTSNYRWLKV
jgi:hypothetical protein